MSEKDKSRIELNIATALFTLGLIALPVACAVMFLWAIIGGLRKWLAVEAEAQLQQAKAAPAS